MYEKTSAKKNRSIGLMRIEEVLPKIVCSSPWSVIELAVLDGYVLRVKFKDGVEGFVDMKTFVFDENPGVFLALQNPEFFKQAFIYYGVITWPGEIDLAPDAMHDEIKAHGTWVLR